MLWYCPIEPYKERYTGQLGGWMRKAFAKNEVEFIAVVPELALPPTISTGQVLDANNRVQWATGQTQKLVHLMASGGIKNGDQILLMDFWHPGIDGLFYALHQYGLSSVRVHSFCWAQSMDVHDFTHPMRLWMRPMEEGIARKLSSVFVADDGLKELFDTATNTKKADTVGLPFNSEEVRKLVSPTEPIDFGSVVKKNRVVFSSRFDGEKDPEFFLQVAAEWKERGLPETEFAMCTSAADVRSNLDYIPALVKQYEADGIVNVYTGLSKKEYYGVLLDSKVQFNCAAQDWVSYTLLEAVTFGCFPVYPMRRSFPQALGHVPEFLYRPQDVDDAIEHVLDGLGEHTPFRNWFTPEAIAARQKLVLSKHDAAIDRMLYKMDVGDHNDYEIEEVALADWKKWRANAC